VAYADPNSLSFEKSIPWLRIDPPRLSGEKRCKACYVGSGSMVTVGYPNVVI
jgi:hypothetical protein